MVGALKLEAVLQDSKSEYYEMYENMKSEIGAEYLDEIKRLYPWYTDHGIKHSEAIIQILGEMLLPSASPSSDVRNELKRTDEIPNKLTPEDLFVLLSSALWHDIGMLIDRTGHAQHLVKYTGHIHTYVKDTAVAQAIYNVACAHSSTKKFSECRNFKALKFYNEKVDVSEKTLAALLRVADEISEDYKRITRKAEIFKKIPKGNKLFWEHAAAISYSGFDNNLIRIKYDVDIDKIFKEYSHFGVQKTLYIFIVERICKILNELAICAPYFSSICRVDALDITIEVQKQKNWMCVEQVINPPISQRLNPFYYPDPKDLLTQFFECYSDFTPDEIKRKARIII